KSDPKSLDLPFFFQAEDGIRDFHVTGVQTCALPILTGLGLAISQRLAGLMNGSVGVQSKLHQGSTFWVKIPFEMASNKTAYYTQIGRASCRERVKDWVVDVSKKQKKRESRDKQVTQK